MFVKCWNDADVDGDGKLNLAEYKKFEAAMHAIKEADGDWNESDHAEENYAICNSVSEGDGFTMADFGAVIAPWMAKFEALKNADQ